MYFYSLILNSNGDGIGSHLYANAPAQLPSNEIACTGDQAANPAQWVVQSGALVAATPTLPQQALAMLNAGLQIVSTATPALNGTYPADAQTSARAAGLLSAIANDLTIPASALQWPDVTGAPHPFAQNDLKNLFQAILNFTAALEPLIAGASGSLPTQPVTIP